MAFVVQYAPSAQTVSQYSYAAGVGQFQQRQRELQLRDQAQLRGIQANLYSQQVARDAAAVRDQARMQMSAAMAERDNINRIQRDMLRHRFEQTARQESHGLQRDLFDAQQAGILERQSLNNQARQQLAVQARDAASGAEAEALMGAAQAMEDYVSSVPNWDDQQKQRIAGIQAKSESLMQDDSLLPLQKARYLHDHWKMIAEEMPRGAPPKTAQDQMAERFVQVPPDMGGGMAIMQPDGKFDWKPPAKKEDQPVQYDSIGAYAAARPDLWAKMLADVMKANEKLSPLGAARLLSEMYQQTLKMGDPAQQQTTSSAVPAGASAPTADDPIGLL